MKLLKTILLAAPATLVAAYSAGAASLPNRKAAPIEYVRVCDAYGAGFFYLPGTNTCLHAGGYARAEYEVSPGRALISPVTGQVTQVAANQDSVGIETRGRIDFDARTQTPWGTVQTVIWLRGNDKDGLRNTTSTVSAIRAGAYIPAGNNVGITLQRAFIRFAGLTAGDAQENFVTMPPFMFGSFPWATFALGAKQLAYTAIFGGGFSATVAIESRSDYKYASGVQEDTYNTDWNTGYNLVGNVRYDAAWGYVQLAGAVGNASVRNNLTAIPNTVTWANSPSNNALTGPTTFGAYAIGLSGDFKLPMIARGDQLHFNLAYGHGMLGLVGCGTASSCSDPGVKRVLGGVLRQDSDLVPIAATGVPGTPGWITWGLTNSWSVAGIYTHYWTPEWRTNLAGGYQRIDPPTAAASAGMQLGNADLYEVGANLIWSPTHGFDIGVEVDYLHLNQQIQNPSPTFVAAGSPGLDVGGWYGKLRLQRTF